MDSTSHQNAVGVAVATFVKSPALSPVKTRLAKDIGRDEATAFYGLCWRAVWEVLRECRDSSDDWHPYWAVAEQEALDQWPDFPSLWQGEGGLGERLASISSQLFRNHSEVFFIGADCPQISCDLLQKARLALRDREFVLGPANDGGFYLLAARKPVPRDVWLEVPYSADDTLREISSRLAAYGKVGELEVLADADHGSDLPEIFGALQQLAVRNRGHEALLRWLNDRVEA